MAEPSMLTAHTSGSARSVFWRHSRVVAAPMTTPNSPVTQVIAPKIRLGERAETRGNKRYRIYIPGKVEGEDTEKQRGNGDQQHL